MILFEEGSLLESIDDNCFEGYMIEGEFELPSSLLHIGKNSFSGCKMLTEVRFNGECKLQTLNNSAFKGCSSLRSFYVPPTLQRFDQSVFSECFNLSKVTGKLGNSNLTVISNIIYNNNLTELIICPPGLSSAFIQSEVSSIASNAFYNCRILIRVIFDSPSNVRTLNENVFAECVSLSTIILPQSIESLSNSCFENCIELKSVTFEGNGKEGSHLLKLMDSSFKGCIQLNSVSFQSPSEFVSIGASTFEGCLSLASISLPPSVKSIGSNCFRQSGLEDIKFNSLLSISEGAFSECSQLRNASLDGIITIPRNLFDGCSLLDRFFFSKQLEIGSRSFAGCNFKHLMISFGVICINESACVN